jgi:hypothetical protein
MKGVRWDMLHEGLRPIYYSLAFISILELWESHPGSLSHDGSVVEDNHSVYPF